eukprot:10126859-Alexandrium_andersonii.AAC.1
MGLAITTCKNRPQNAAVVCAARRPRQSMVAPQGRLRVEASVGQRAVLQSSPARRAANTASAAWLGNAIPLTQK